MKRIIDKGRKIKQKIRESNRFVKEDLWRVSLKELPRKKSFFLKQIRIIVLSVRGFTEDRIMLRASSLTFFSLLSIVPTLALAFGIAKGFGFENVLEREISRILEGHESLLDQVITFANAMLDRTKGGLIAGIGLLVLFFAVMNLLTNIEKAFNNIWEVKKSRSFVRKFTDYLSIMLLAPTLMIAASSLSVYAKSLAEQYASESIIVGAISPVLLTLLKFSPYIIMWMMLTLLFVIMPHTKVKFKPAMFAALVSGTIYQLLQYGYINVMVSLVNLNAIYGSFAALPLFLFWLQISWLTILFGAELAFANQNVHRYEFEKEATHISQKNKRIIELMILKLIIDDFDKGNKPKNAEQIANTLEMPVRLARVIIEDLKRATLIYRVSDSEDKILGYQPAISIDKITVFFALNTIDSKGYNDLVVKHNESYEKISNIIKQFDKHLKTSDENLLLREL